LSQHDPAADKRLTKRIVQIANACSLVHVPSSTRTAPDLQVPENAEDFFGMPVA
jgi:hypothetical protein